MKKLVSRTIAERVRKALLVAICIIIPVFALIYFLQNVMMFHYARCRESREALQSMQGFREIAFTAENGKTYHGAMYINSEEKAPLVIYFGGNAEVSYRHMLVRESRDQWRYFEGFNYLFVDYEGYGANDGRPSYHNMYEQALAVFDVAASLPEVDSGRIVVMGFSLGTGSAVHLAANRPVAGLILAAPFANGYDLCNNVVPIFHGPMKLLVRQKFPSDQFAPDVTCPALIIASRSDEVIPFVSSERLSNLISGNVEFIALNDDGHNHLFDAEGVFDSVQSFLGDVRGARRDGL